jgi:hypothetical protein
MKDFTDKDVQDHGCIKGAGTINCEKSDLINNPPERKVLKQTDGYGAKLNSGYSISFNGKVYRIYTTIYSNNGSCWFKTKGKQIFVRA